MAKGTSKGFLNVPVPKCGHQGPYKIDMRTLKGTCDQCGGEVTAHIIAMDRPVPKGAAVTDVRIGPPLKKN
jgi:hypothetical protein